MPSLKKSKRPACGPRSGPSRNGTRPTSTVIWPLSRRRAQWVVNEIKARFPKEAETITDFQSAAADARCAVLVTRFKLSLPPELDLALTVKE